MPSSSLQAAPEEACFARTHYKRGYQNESIVPITAVAQVVSMLKRFVHTYCHVTPWGLHKVQHNATRAQQHKTNAAFTFKAGSSFFHPPDSDHLDICR